MESGGSTKILDFRYDQSGAPYSLTYTVGSTSTVYYYITNLQGDVMYLVDSSGNQVAAYTYDPYGKVLTATGTMAEINPLRYRGYYQDSETGFYYLQSRYYDPLIGRLINADSLVDIDHEISNNLFVYCDNNPVNKVDYLGTSGKYVELGRGWYYRIDTENVGTGVQRHIHIWNDQKNIYYAQNEDGSPHDQGKNNKGKLPKWLQKAVLNKEHWDYNGKRDNFFSNTQYQCWVDGIQFTFANGESVFRPNQLVVHMSCTVNFYEEVYYKKEENVRRLNANGKSFYFPMVNPASIPSFSFSFSSGMLPIPLLY